MAPIIPACEPVNAIAGDTWTWTHQNSDFAISEGWTISYSIRGASVLTWDAAWVTNDGFTWTVLIPAANTTLTAGSYAFERHYTGTGTYSGRRYTAQLPRLEVIPNAATASAGDLQTYEEKLLTAVRSLLYPSSTIVSDVESYQIHGRALTKMSKRDLWKWERELTAIVNRQKNGGRNKSIRIGFGNART